VGDQVSLGISNGDLENGVIIDREWMVNPMIACSYDPIVEKYGGWARLCDPTFSPSKSIYAELESAGLTKEQFDEIRRAQSMPARDRATLDIADDLVRTWSRYLCGLVTEAPTVELGRFIDLPLAEFWRDHRSALAQFEIDDEEVEALIQASLDDPPRDHLTYRASRVTQIAKLARLCRNYPPDEEGPDLHPALVPIGPTPPTLEAANALQLPESDQMDEAS